LKYLAIGAFRLDPRAGELSRKGYAVRLQEQPFLILKMLAERPGEVVLREEIRKRLWPNDTLVDFDHSVNAAMNKLRDALGDKAKSPRYIETVARRGYRLIATVEEVEGPDTAPSPLAPIPSEPIPASIAVNLTGALIGHYRVLEVLGGGGMGVVYKAEDLKLGRAVALKFPPPEQWGDADSRARLEREARAGAALDHPNICTIYEVGEHQGKPFIAMQFLSGETLRQRIAAGPLPLVEAISIVSRIGAGLEAAHRASLVHGDIKPANIFLTAAGEVKILDFGLASHPTDESAADAAPAGTAAYMSPEQHQGLALDARSDLFSLGVVLKEIAAPPHPPSLHAFLQKAMDSDRDRRFQTAAEFRTALQRIRLPRPARYWLAAAVLAVIAVFAAAARWVRSPNPFAPESAERSITSNLPEEAVDAAAISPDGKLLAYSRGRRLFLQPLALPAERELATGFDSPVRSLAWAHASGRLYFTLQNGGLYALDSDGKSAPVRLREHGGALAVSPDDRSIAFLDHQDTDLFVMRPDGSAAEPVFHVRADFHLAWPHWTIAGMLVFAQVGSGYENCGGWITSWNASTHQIADLAQVTPCLGGIASLPGPRLIYFTRGATDSELYELPLGGDARPRRLRDHLGKVDTLTASLDGNIYYRKTTGIVSVYVGELASGSALANIRRVSTSENNSNYVHGWTADSRSVLFESLRGGQYHVFRKDIDDRGPDVPLPGSEAGVGPKLSPDGAWVLFNRSIKLVSGEPGSRYQLVRLPIAGGVAEAVADDPGAFNFHCGRAPGTRCVLMSAQAGRVQFRALDPLHGAGPELASIPELPPDWDLSPDGGRLAMLSTGATVARIHVIDLARNAASDLAVPDWSRFQTINWSADGASWLLCAERASAPGAFLIQVNAAGGVSVVHQFKAPCPWGVPSPDGKHIAFSESSPGVNVRTMVP
jgi:DNA-binding winged helix-turn-helix (wHTH) protein/Tol biopolymer transport system component